MEKDTTQFTKSEHTAARRHSLGNILVYLLLTIWALVRISTLNGITIQMV